MAHDQIALLPYLMPNNGQPVGRLYRRVGQAVALVQYEQASQFRPGAQLPRGEIGFLRSTCMSTSSQHLDSDAGFGFPVPRAFIKSSEPP